MIKVHIENEFQNSIDIDVKWINLICNTILNDNNNVCAKITIIFSDDERLYNLKRNFFGEDLFTDVITFNLEEQGENIEGEIYISIDRVYDNAIKYKQKFDMEIKRIIIHGCLHLIGYNDKTIKEKKQMTSLEDYYLINT